MQEEGWRVGLLSGGVIGAFPHARTKRNVLLLAITGFHAIVKKRMSRSPDCWDGNAAMTYCYWMPSCPINRTLGRQGLITQLRYRCICSGRLSFRNRPAYKMPPTPRPDDRACAGTLMLLWWWCGSVRCPKFAEVAPVAWRGMEIISIAAAITTVFHASNLVEASIQCVW